ncbi:hypothetical protein [Sphingopyxis sp. HXXIV]|uniref:hypothetical protein n=1 Tax=Sphingopyxis sp. HXXIV TaxID=1759075 RepID=UPI0012E3A2DB|nr:hypothetical protein [Sphingopyxis sp. HXXIV]
MLSNGRANFAQSRISGLFRVLAARAGVFSLGRIPIERENRPFVRSDNADGYMPAAIMAGALSGAQR